MTVNLEILNSFQFSGGDAIAYDRTTDNLIISRITLASAQPRLVGWRVNQVTRSGKYINSFSSDELSGASGIAALPNGNVLIVSIRDQRIVEYTKNGQLARGGIDFVNPAIQTRGQTNLTGITYDSGTNTIFATDFVTPRIFQFSTQGEVLKTINITPAIPGGLLRGIAVDQVTGNFFVTDDDDARRTNDNRIYEVSPTGQILTTIDVVGLTGLADPEGIAIDSSTRTAYVIFDNDDEDGATLYKTDRNRVASFKIEVNSFEGDNRINDSRTGDANGNTLLGGYGSDTMMGMEGADIIDGGFDDDILNGNQGADQVLGSDGNDFARGGEDNDFVGGGEGNDTVFGDQGNDTVTGGNGNDILNGNAGNDSIVGGAGDDMVRGGNNEDFLEGDAGNDTLMGDFGNDTVNGGEGNDILMGQSGEDILNGGAGADTLTGGASKDIFVLSQGGDDIITDFVRGEDLIGLTGGLTYEQLTFTQELVNNQPRALIRNVLTGELFATVNGISSLLLTPELFTTV